jgi:2-oxoglutarate dehydrogenase E1 component
MNGAITAPPNVALGAAPSPIAAPAPIKPAPAAPLVTAEEVTPLRGAAARIVENMVASLGVPTATSMHPTPAKVIEVNRTIINEHLARTTGKKISFTHLIAFAVVRAVKLVPSMNATFVEDFDGKGTPGVIRHQHIGLGIAIDIERSSGRSLLVPAIKNSDTYDFLGFIGAYEELIGKARNNKLSVDDFSGVTMTITNPGTLGTTQSVPRLMSGQGAIIGVGALDFPVEYRATDPETLASLGVGKVVTLTSTYDHRIIQGAESGLFLKYVDEYLVGAHNFYEEVFSSLGVTATPMHLTRDTGNASKSASVEASGAKQLAVASLIDAYRTFGHRIADINPFTPPITELPEELDLATYGLSAWDLDREFLTPGFGSKPSATLREILALLRSSYCQTMSIEYRHIQNVRERDWIAAQVESAPPELSADEQRHILFRLNETEIFESFLHSRYVGQKRFGLQGGTATVTFIDAVLQESLQAGVNEAILGMSHRGRLNVLANVIGKPYCELFGDFENNLDPLTIEGSGDMKYHKGGVGIWTSQTGGSLPVTLVPNPSHLEAVNSVVEGVVRAKQDRQGDEGHHNVLTLLTHGDASFAGQGVVAETLNLSQLPAYNVGGTVHLVINNQVGFTTPPSAARSTLYATDVAKSIEAPIIHVNGDHPEAVVHAARLASAYRLTFGKDVVVDLICYRTYGHNEGDEPSYTQPVMYREIAQHQALNARYGELLVSREIISEEDLATNIAGFTQHLATALEEARAIPVPNFPHLPVQTPKETVALPKDTGVEQGVLIQMIEQLTHRPPAFHLHPKLARQFDQRDELVSSGEVDWATGEALAFGSLMVEGRNIRLIGQDARRGTFSHRHATLIDYEDGSEFVPLNGLADLWSGLGTFSVYDSLLSEYAALGFEYGYSVESQDTLVIWEAQFGDFANGAQVVIDNFIVAAEEKWGQTSGLVMLLPHGYEGQGPEHSSARLERYLSSAAKDNVTIAQPTTTAQYFHLLRAQVHNPSRRPLIVMSPKYLLRAHPARSAMSELSQGTFHEVLDDPSAATIDAAGVDRIILCSGKVAFEAIDRRDARRESNAGAPHSAIVRVEQLYPWPEEQLAEIIARYPNATELVWLQDEPSNMGSWSFVFERLMLRFGDKLSIQHVSRTAAGSPATGSHVIHELEVEMLMDEAVGAYPRA